MTAPAPGWFPQLDLIGIDSDVRAGALRHDSFQLATRMTLLLLLVASPPYWYVRTPLIAAGIGGLLLPRIRESRALWLAITTILFTSNYHHWYSADNHKHLLAYWCLTVFVAASSKGRSGLLALNARLLVGAAFGLSVFWKLNLEFMSGEFFHYTFLFDPRFRSIAEVIGGIAPASYDANQLVHGELSQAAIGSVRALTSSPALTPVGCVMAGWTLLIEAAVALAFLFSSRHHIARFRSALLLCFVATTYFLAPVLGFAYLLLCMGVTTLESRAELERYRMPYIVAFAGVSLYAMPWRQLATTLMGNGS
jgi:hypothetical protein